MPLLLSFASLFICSEIKSTPKQENTNNNNNDKKIDVNLKVNDEDEETLRGTAVVVDGFRYLLNKGAEVEGGNTYYACAHKKCDDPCFLVH
jgi:hypothetical protein